MSDFILPIFPFDSTAITVTTTVWVGVWIVVFFNLRLGWTLSGLVVPGYLVPLLITQPLSVAVILAESLVTYWIAWLISEKPRNSDYWCSFFGRDRFFVIVVISVLVRAVGDGWLLPWCGEQVSARWDFNLDYRNSLHSYGLIVVALIANYFWKPGVVRGFMPLMTTVGLTYFIVKIVLVGCTNFNVGNLHLLYEDVSTSLLASPKAYIVVITTAFIASWMNLKYSWEFNGILIPALLALLWHDPGKIFVSIFESVLILATATLLLKSPLFRRATMEGGTKLVFFFTICFAYRLILSHMLPIIAIGIDVTDSFGFGYLLSTLIAIKAYDKKVTIGMIRGIVHVSMMGAVFGCLLGFALTIGPQLQFGGTQRSISGDDTIGVERTDRPLVDVIRGDKVLLYQQRIPESYKPPLNVEIQQFKTSLRTLQKYMARRNDTLLDQSAIELAEINYELLLVADRYVYLREKSPVNGWGMYVLDCDRDSGLSIQVPAPLDEWATVESGLCLFHQLPSFSLAIAGSDRETNLDGAADVLKTRTSFFNTFHSMFPQAKPLQIRGHTRSGVRAINRLEWDEEPQSVETVGSQLWVKTAVPESLKLPNLKALVGGFDIHWNPTPSTNVLRDAARNEFAELVLNREDRRTLVSRLVISGDDNDLQSRFEILNLGLHQWIQQESEKIAQQGSDNYKPAKVEQMLFIDEEVLEPLFNLLAKLPDGAHLENENETPAWLTEPVLNQLKSINAAAAVMNYRLLLIRDRSVGEDYIALVEHDNAKRRNWGTFVFRPGFVEPYSVEVPRPLFERHSLAFGVNLFQHPRSSLLMIAGAHSRANFDGTADISRLSNRVNLFNLVRHVMLRNLSDRPLLMIQARAIQAPVEADIVLATDDGTIEVQKLSPITRRLYQSLTNDRLSVAFVDGSQETAGYELGMLMQASVFQTAQNKEVVSLWLSPSLRTRFRSQEQNISIAAQFEACKIPTIEANLFDHLENCFDRANIGQSSPDQATTGMDNRPPAIESGLKSALTQYVQTFDVVRLYSIKADWKSTTLTRLIDTGSGQAFLLVQSDGQPVPSVLNLSGFVGTATSRIQRYDRAEIENFIRSRAMWLEVEVQ